MFEKIAYAAPAAAGAPAEPNILSMFFPFFFIFFIMYFLVWRPQQRQRRELQSVIDNLKKGDRIVTTGGLIGTVTSIQNDYVVVKTGDNDNTKLEILKSAVSGLRK